MSTPMPSPSVPSQAAPSAPLPSPPPAEAARPKMVAVKLERHYRPVGVLDDKGQPTGIPNHEVVGHWTPRIERKDPRTNKMEVVQEEAFHPGEPMPPPQAGVGSQASLKLWAGTVVRLPVDEAKRARAAGIGTIEVDDAA